MDDVLVSMSAVEVLLHFLCAAQVLSRWKAFLVVQYHQQMTQDRYMAAATTSNYALVSMWNQKSSLPCAMQEMKNNGAANVVEIDRHIAELQQGLRDISELYNEFAQPYKVQSDSW